MIPLLHLRLFISLRERLLLPKVLLRRQLLNLLNLQFQASFLNNLYILYHVDLYTFGTRFFWDLLL